MSDNKVRSLWHRLTRSQEVAEAEELQERLRRMEVMGARPIAQCAVGDAVLTRDFPEDALLALLGAFTRSPEEATA